MFVLDTALTLFDDNEVLQSQLPVIVVLQKLGWTYVSANEVTIHRGGRSSAVLLDGILREQLARINQITFKGKQRAFSVGLVARAIQRIKDIVLVSGSVAAAQDAYDLLTLGES